MQTKHCFEDSSEEAVTPRECRNCRLFWPRMRSKEGNLGETVSLNVQRSFPSTISPNFPSVILMLCQNVWLQTFNIQLVRSR